MLIELDGSQGEGGGQILRSALSLSMCTGHPLRIHNIRAKRKKPGLLRQHLTAVQAAAAISQAEVDGAALHSTQLSFTPGPVQGGDYRFNIGSAGSCTLVLQTLLPALLYASQDSRVTITGGTHNSMSPPFHFLQRAYLPLLHRMGANVELLLKRFGFYPAGGGEIQANITVGTPLVPLYLYSRGERVKAYAESFFAGLPAHIAQRELAVVKEGMNWHDEQLLMRSIDSGHGPGNAMLLTFEHDHVTEVFTGFGEKGLFADTLAKNTVAEARRYLSSNAVVATYLADQLLLPMALAGGGSFTSSEWSQHAVSNAEVIQQFLPVAIVAEKTDSRIVRVNVVAKN